MVLGIVLQQPGWVVSLDIRYVSDFRPYHEPPKTRLLGTTVLSRELVGTLDRNSRMGSRVVFLLRKQDPNQAFNMLDSFRPVFP